MFKGNVVAAFAVHAFTASGAVVGLFALERAAAGDLRGCFVLLGVALAVDAADGPAARWLRVADVLPRFSGARLDLVVDYLTYCVVPAYVILVTDMVPAGAAPWAVGAILVSSLFHFADRQSKTDDGYFVGFPAIWNLVVFHIHVLQPAPWWAAAIIALFVLLTFVPMKWIHPLRAPRLRPLTLSVVACWAAAAVSVLVWPAGAEAGGAGALQSAILIAAIVYVCGLCIARSLLPGWRPGREKSGQAGKARNGY